MIVLILLIFNAFINVNARLDANFISLLRSKVTETSNLLFSQYPNENFIVLDDALNDFESKSLKILEKYENSGLSRNQLDRLSTKLENEWKSSVQCTLDQSCNRRLGYSVGDGHPAGSQFKAKEEVNSDQRLKELKELKELHQKYSSIITKKSQNSDSVVELFKILRQKLSQPISRLYHFQLIIFYAIFGPLFNFVSQNTIKIRNSMIEAASNDANVEKASQILTSKSIQDPLTTISSNYFSETLLKSAKSHEFEELINTLEIEKVSQRITSGAIQETTKNFPSKKSFLIGSIIFVAVPIIISLVSRLCNISKKNEFL